LRGTWSRARHRNPGELLLTAQVRHGVHAVLEMVEVVVDLALRIRNAPPALGIA
jgi:hypothetical protein